LWSGYTHSALTMALRGQSNQSSNINPIVRRNHDMFGMQAKPSNTKRRIYL
jgi:hypothetical protein